MASTKIVAIIIIAITLLLGILLVAAIAVGVGFGIQSALQPVNSSVSAPQPIAEFNVTIINNLPSDQAFANGFIDLKISLPDNIRVRGNVIIYLDGIIKFSLNTFPLNLQIPTQGLEDGIHNVTIRAISTDNATGYGVIQVLVEDPGFVLLGVDYPLEIYPGMTVTISVEVSGSPSHFVATFSSIFGQTVITNSTSVVNGSTVVGTQFIPSDLPSEEGFYTIPLQVFDINQRSLIVPRIEVFLQSAETNPFTIEEGIIDRRSFPQTNATNQNLNFTLPPDIQSSITTGETLTIPLEIRSDSNVSEILVGFQGFGQHFIIPITSLQSSITRRSTDQQNLSVETYNLRLALPNGALESGRVESIDTLIRLRDTQGGLGPVRRFPTTLSSSQSGTLRITLSWDKKVDLDLHVVDPNNEEIYYGRTSSTGQVGSIDLDSNPACSIDNINKENIYYEKAISGRYIVRVDLYDSCSRSTSINFEVDVTGCKISKTVSGSFSSDEEDQGGAGSGREVLSFNAACSNYLANGTVRYKTPSSTLNPLGSIVRVVDSQGKVLGQSQVERDPALSRRGVYRVPYDTSDPSQRVYLEFLSSNKKIEVTDHVGKVHVYRVRKAIIPNTEPTAIGFVIINIDGSSGAFHIMTTLTRMIPLYLAYGGKPSDYPRKADWEKGKYAKGTFDPDDGGTYYDPKTQIISFDGHVTNPDEFQDSVILHEFAHLIICQTGAVITGDGDHNPRAQISPSFAFSEGYATYLGQKVIGNLMYCDEVCYDLSNLASIGVTLGTSSNGHSSGDISENVVASAAFNLDNNGLGGIMVKSLTDPSQLLKATNYNRLGDKSAVDFADMVSIVVCPLGVQKRNKQDELLKTKYKLPWITEPNFCENLP